MPLVDCILFLDSCGVFPTVISVLGAPGLASDQPPLANSAILTITHPPGVSASERQGARRRVLWRRGAEHRVEVQGRRGRGTPLIVTSTVGDSPGPPASSPSPSPPVNSRSGRRVLSVIQATDERAGIPGSPCPVSAPLRRCPRPLEKELVKDSLIILKEPEILSFRAGLLSIRAVSIDYFV